MVELHPLAFGVGVIGIALLLCLFITTASGGPKKLHDKLRNRSASQRALSGQDLHGHSALPLPGFAKTAAEEGNMKMLQRWLKSAEINIDGRDRETGRSALHFAALRGNVDIVKELLDAGADPCVQDVDGATPLHLAAVQGQGLCVKILLDRGSDPYMVTTQDETAQQLAEEAGHVGCQRLIQLHILKQNQNESSADADISLRTFRRGSGSNA